MSSDSNSNAVAAAAPVVPVATTNHELKFGGNLDKLAQEAIELIERTNAFEKESPRRQYSLPTSLWGLILTLRVEKPEIMAKLIPPGSLLEQNFMNQVLMSATAELKEKELRAMNNIRQLEAGRFPVQNYRPQQQRPNNGNGKDHNSPLNTIKDPKGLLMQLSKMMEKPPESPASETTE